MDKRLWNLDVLSSGERSALRRCAGQMMGSNAQAMRAFYHALCIYDLPRYKEEIYFSAMSMECLWRENDFPVKVPFEVMLERIYNDPNASESMKRRTMAFIDLPWGEDGFLLGKICNLVRMMRANDSRTMPDFEALAVDLANWNNEDRKVQRDWIRTICKAPKYDEETAQKEEE